MQTPEYDYRLEDPFLREQEELKEEMERYYEQIDDAIEVERSKQEHYEYMLKCGEIVEVMTLRAISMLAANDEEEYNAIINNSMHLFIGMIGLTRDDSRVKAEREANLRKGN